MFPGELSIERSQNMKLNCFVLYLYYTACIFPGQMTGQKIPLSYVKISVRFISSDSRKLYKTFFKVSGQTVNDTKTKISVPGYSRCLLLQTSNFPCMYLHSTNYFLHNLYEITVELSIVQGGSNMTGTDLCVNKPHCAAAVRP